MNKKVRDTKIEDWAKILKKGGYLRPGKPEETLAELICISCLNVGAEKHRVKKYMGKKICPYTQKDFDVIWNRLRSNGYFSGGKINILEGKSKRLSEVDFGLMVCCASGFIKRTLEKA